MKCMYTTCAVTAAAVLLLIAARPQPPDTPAASPRLAGARPTIDAARFPSLQAAINAVPEGGALVQIPAGHFVIKTPVILNRGDVTLQGAGSATVIENVNQGGKPAIVLAHPSEDGSRKNELWRMRLADFRLIGNPKSGSAIVAQHINEIMIDGVTISYHGGHGIFLDHCYEDPRICDCLITYNKKTGVQLEGCHDIVVSACQFEENDDALQCLDSFNLTMTGNNIDDHLGRGIVVENTYGSVLAGNMIEECAAAAIVLDRDCYGITISANVIAHNGAGIDLRDAHGCSVSANTMTLMKTAALRVGPASGRIAVTGNSFCNSYIGNGQIKRGTDDRSAAGLVLDNTRNVAIVGNQFSSVRPQAVTVKGKTVQDVVCAANLLTDVSSQEASLQQSTVATNHRAEQ